ncbi:MAG: YgaP family membrane protein, partial [Longimicrobiaceae bacterium]
MASTDIDSYGTGGTDAWAQRPGPAGAVRGACDSGYDEGSDANVGQAERWASLVGGGVIALAGLRRGDSVGLAAAVVGGLFLYRGLTGHSPIYDQLDVSTASRGSERGLAGLVR